MSSPISRGSICWVSCVVGAARISVVMLPRVR